MTISFSAIKNIDFSNQENLIFLGFAIFFFIVLIIALISLLKSLAKLFRTLARAKRYYSTNSESNNTQGEKQIHGDPFKKEREILIAEKNIVIPEKKSIVAPTIDYISPKKEAEETKKEAGDNFSSKEKKDIEKGLKSLKGSAKTDNGKDSVESHMPRNINQEGDEKELFEKITVSTSRPKEDISSSLFGDGQGLSRRELKNELRNNPEIWKEARSAGITAGRAGRAELVKDIPKVLKGNISKGDLKKTIKVLRQKLYSSGSSPQEHAKIRKEIKFFKKLKEL